MLGILRPPVRRSSQPSRNVETRHQTTGSTSSLLLLPVITISFIQTVSHNWRKRLCLPYNRRDFHQLNYVAFVPPHTKQQNYSRIYSFIMQQFRVKVPEGIEGNQIVSVNAAGGQFCVRVPEGVKEGDNFFFTLSPQQIEQANDKKIDTVELVEGTKTFTSQPLLFHDMWDLALALCLGFTIGGAIVLGFVCGVLYVTS